MCNKPYQSEQGKGVSQSLITLLNSIIIIKKRFSLQMEVNDDLLEYSQKNFLPSWKDK